MKLKIEINAKDKVTRLCSDSPESNHPPPHAKKVNKINKNETTVASEQKII